MAKLPFSLVDTHVHLWDPDFLTYTWLESLPQLNRRFSLAEFSEQSRTVDVGAIVFVQCDAARNESRKEAHWIQELSHEDRRLKGAVAFAPLEMGDAVQEELEQLAALPIVKGVRRLLQDEEPEFGLQTSFIDGLKMLPKLNLSFDICIRERHLGAAVEMVRQCPEVRFMLDHIAKPKIKQGVKEPWGRLMHEIAAFPNVTCKLSGMVAEADLESWKPDDLRPYIDTVMDAFGVDRVAFGGDWPVSTLGVAYASWVETLYDLLHDYSLDELRKIFCENGARFYRIN